MLNDFSHPNQQKYGVQRIMIIGVDDYAYLVPYVEDENEILPIAQLLPRTVEAGWGRYKNELS